MGLFSDTPINQYRFQMILEFGTAPYRKYLY